MALIKCIECQREISSDARSCPGCGKIPKKSVGLGGYIIAGLVLLIIFNIAIRGNSSAPAVPTLTPEQQAIQDKETSHRNARITNTIRTQRSVKDALRDPKSVEWISSEANEDGSVVCLVYRARNGFGGMNVERATMANQKVSMNGSSWGQNCVGKKLFPQ